MGLLHVQIAAYDPKPPDSDLIGVAQLQRRVPMRPSERAIAEQRTLQKRSVDMFSHVLADPLHDDARMHDETGQVFARTRTMNGALHEGGWWTYLMDYHRPRGAAHLMRQFEVHLDRSNKQITLRHTPTGQHWQLSVHAWENMERHVEHCIFHPKILRCLRRAASVQAWSTAWSTAANQGADMTVAATPTAAAAPLPLWWWLFWSTLLVRVAADTKAQLKRKRGGDDDAP